MPVFATASPMAGGSGSVHGNGPSAVGPLHGIGPAPLGLAPTPSPVGFPIVESTTVHMDEQIVASRNIEFPAGTQSGDLIVWALVDGEFWGGASILSPGWTELANLEDNIAIMAACKIVDGSEGGVCAVSLPDSFSPCWIVFRISGASGNVEIAGPAGNFSSAPYTMPECTASWGAKKNLFIGILGAYQEGSTPLSFPVPSQNNLEIYSEEGDAYCAGFTNDEELAAFTPGSIGGDVASWNSYTIVVEPAA